MGQNFSEECTSGVSKTTQEVDCRKFKATGVLQREILNEFFNIFGRFWVHVTPNSTKNGKKDQ